MNGGIKLGDGISKGPGPAEIHIVALGNRLDHGLEALEGGVLAQIRSAHE